MRLLLEEELQELCTIFLPLYLTIQPSKTKEKGKHRKAEFRELLGDG